MNNVYTNTFSKIIFILLIFDVVSGLLSKDSFNKIRSNDFKNNPEDNKFLNKYLVIIDNTNKDNFNPIIKLYHGSYGRNKKYDIALIENSNNIKRRFTDAKEAREKIKRANLLKSQQKRKVREITNFMADHYLTTNYLYDEVQRIQRQRVVKDDLRRMVEYLEKPQKKKIKDGVMKCYYQARKGEKIPIDEWRHDTNNLAINTIKDPYNFGYIN